MVIVVPQPERGSDSWKPGAGNYFFELVTSARERYGAHAVDEFVVDEDIPPVRWHADLSQFLEKSNATHCIAFAEGDPGRAGYWHWNDFAAVAGRSWNGSFVGVLTDGVYLLHQARAARFRHAFPRSVFIAIDIGTSRHAHFVPDRTIFGPCFLPISRASVGALDEPIASTASEREFDIVFVGKVYPNREGLLDELKSSGLRVGVNPHRMDPATRPAYGDYISGLRRGHFTVNLSEAGGTPFPQLKSRMLEGPLFGTIVCTDESKLAQCFFDASDFVAFESVDELKAKIVALLDDESSLEAIRDSAHKRAHAIASDAFWSTAEHALVENDLPLPTLIRKD